MAHIGKVIIFSAPSGAGKTTLVHRLLAQCPNLAFSISATTRQPRQGIEQNGVDYYFMSVDEFKQKRSNAEFVEWEEVYKGLYYATPKSEVNRIWQQGKHVLADVDVKGGLRLKKYFKDKALAIFVKAPSPDVIKQRLIDRGTETPQSLQVRMDRLMEELTYEPQFDTTVVNQNLDEAIAQAKKLVIDFIEK